MACTGAQTLLSVNDHIGVQLDCRHRSAHGLYFGMRERTHGTHFPFHWNRSSAAGAAAEVSVTNRKSKARLIWASLRVIEMFLTLDPFWKNERRHGKRASFATSSSSFHPAQ